MKPLLEKTVFNAVIILAASACFAQTTVRWSMDWTHLANPAVYDSAFGLGQGTIGGPSEGVVEFDHLWYFGNAGFTFSSVKPPQTLFSDGFSPHGNSFDAGEQFDEGVLFFPQDQYGNEFDYHGSFTVEGFFKTHADQSAGGVQQILLQAENDYSYSISINEGGAGWLRFAANTTIDGIKSVDANARNYADGSWYYFAARFSEPSDEMSLTVLTADGQTEQKEVQLSEGSQLQRGGSANMLIGRENYGGSRQFNGLIDELRISDGIVPNSELMGRIEAERNPYPAPREQGVGLDIELQWDSGSGVYAYNVYFGRTEPPKFKTQQKQTGYSPNTLKPGTTYLWRVDEILMDGTAVQGEVWSFTTQQPACDEFSVHDYNDDCIVDINDLSHFVAAWLDCGIVPENACF
ncbi:hypothetical protein L21SP3_01087 [Sedimentisphaera cyanobacteriorum]|uniref:LamG-like jellyroll fold domain-containing protein n=1 Tax=Sedimentisphaera cyanobacteriorum TaxID=1940790 RepID=A0A1Q2HPR9_9BACT|nr:LamG-like jellyroll fold domain-containing protein [Sedimentisphaera cyanobacteriorum]AQQ09284.1 hypothetical protein L21SP3_01087 [Sedimentisphaera cyanobacteriorum]